METINEVNNVVDIRASYPDPPAPNKQEPQSQEFAEIVISIEPRLLIKSFFQGMGLDVKEIKHPILPSSTYIVTLEEPRKLVDKLKITKSYFRAEINTGKRELVIHGDNESFLENAKGIINNMMSLMNDLKAPNGQWTIKIVE